MTDEEQVMYIASSNETLFLENRQYFIFYPVAILGILLLFTMIGVFGYISITYLVDSRTKHLVSEIINELKERF